MIRDTHDIGKFFFVFLRATWRTWPVTVSPTWEMEPPYRYSPTLVLHLWPTTLAIGFGWWQDSGVEDLELTRAQQYEIAEANAAYDAYVALHGEVDRAQWDAARAQIAGQYEGDWEGEIGAMQRLGVI